MGPSIATISAAIQEEFEKLVAAKNSWGKNELTALLATARANALARYL